MLDQCALCTQKSGKKYESVFCVFVVRLFAFLLGKSIVLLDVLTGNVLHHLVGNENGQGDLHDDDPLGPGQWTNVEDHWHWVNVQNEEMERH